MEDAICLCALGKIFGFEPRAAHNLISAIPPSEIFSLKRDELREILGPYSKYLDAISPAALEDAEKELSGLREEGYDFVPMTSPGYPPLLLECEDAPLGLYLRSSDTPENIFTAREAVAVVGTRDISPYGKEICTRIVESLSRTAAKPLIVSGLALGVDATAHATALDGGLPTVGVMATGIEDVYPYRNSALAARIARTPGSGLVTDYPPGTKAVAIHFLRRNRIIAGICKAVILVESKIKGGGMMTANLAFGYSRDVYAVPGRIGDSRSAGCNLLIREKKAEPVTDPEELAGTLFPGVLSRRGKPDIIAALQAAYSDKELADKLVRIAGLIRDERGISMDALCEKTSWTWPEVSALTGLLESEGFISTDLLQRCSINPKFA